MALILDTSVLVEGERSDIPLEKILLRIRESTGETTVALSAVSVVELTHGIHRASTQAISSKRRVFVERAIRNLVIYPLTTEVAQLAGRIDGEQAARGIRIPFQDLLIGCTAVHLDFGLATYNTRHFQLIPGLEITSF